MVTAGIWLRVSSGKQDEANQEPGVLRHCEQAGYEIAQRYEVHDRSAFRGEQDAKLAEMLHDMRTGHIQVLVFWHSDRLERRGTEKLFEDLGQIREAGGTFESVQEPFLGETDIAGTVMTAIAGAVANQYSVHLSEQVSLAVSRVRGNGGYWGNTHWGYSITGDKYHKGLVRTDEGTRYIPEVFQRVADGQSCHQVAEWLRSGPRPGISDKTVYKMIRNRIYAGTKMANGVAVAKVPPLVDAKLWTAANNRLSNGKRGRRTPARGKPALLTSVLFCPRCPRDGAYAPMYRIRPQNTRKDGTKTVTEYYRCRGHAPELKGCGNMVRLDSADFYAGKMLEQSVMPWTTLERVNGENHDAELAEVQLALSDLPKRGLSDDEEDAERKRLRAERNRLQSLPNTPDRWDEVPTGQTVGEHWAGLDYDGQRAFLVANVKFYAESYTVPETNQRVPMLRIESRLYREAAAAAGQLTPAGPAEAR
jgi:DNA invertase Pin-like site-specific DNA recombinase